MDWIKKSFDRVILVVFGLVLLGLAAVLFMELTAFDERFAERNSARPPDNTIAAPPLERIETTVALLRGPRSWGAHEGSLFVSRPYLLNPDGELVDPMEDDTPLFTGPDGNPVPNSWIIKYDLPYWQGDLLESDLDGDGFSVWEEFVAGTDPTDPDSKPGYWTKLRLKEFISIPFRVIFQGSADGGTTFTINSLDADTRTQFKQLGDTIDINEIPYTLKEYEPKSTVVNQIERDISELTLLDEATGDTIVLVRDQETDSPSSFALFVNLMDAQEFEVQLEDAFKLPQDEEIKYKLVDIAEDRAVIQNVETGEKHTVPGLN